VNQAAASYLLALVAFTCMGLAAGNDPASSAAAVGRVGSTTRDAVSPADIEAAGRTPAPDAASRDRAFVQAAARAGRQEIADARDAMQRARRGEVRSAAKSMLDQHTEANAALEALAVRKGWALPTPKDPDPSPLPVDDFDSAYLEHQASSHRQAIALFRAQAEAARGDPDLAALARATLPILEHHLETLVGLRHPGVQKP
jgi:putative membrane protein